MKRTLSLVVLLTSILFSQTDFWSHYFSNAPIRQLEITANGTFYAVSDSSVLRSYDIGNSWDTILIKPNGLPIHNIELFCGKSTTSSNTLVVQAVESTNRYIGYSSNEGETWVTISSTEYFSDLVIDNNGDLFKITDTLYKSTDNGSSWQYITTPTSLNMGSNLEIDAENNLYINRRYSRSWYDPPYTVTSWEYKFYKSNNDGQNWNLLFEFSESDVDCNQERIINFFSTVNGNLFLDVCDRCLAGDYYTIRYSNGIMTGDYIFEHISGAIIDQENLQFMSSSSMGVRSSTDNGVSWIDRNSGLPSLYIFSIVKDLFGYLYVGTDNGIYKSNSSSLILTNNFVNQFEDTRTGDTSHIEIVLHNSFEHIIDIDSIVCNSNYFEINNQNNSSIPANDSISIELTFIPDTMKTYIDTVFIYTENFVSMFEVIGNCPRPLLLNLPYDNDFGDVQIGDTASLTISLKSESINTITIDSIYLQTGQYFFINQLVYPLYLNENDTISFSVFFVPLVQSVFPKQDNIKILSNAQNNPLNLLVKGRGVNPTNVANDELINSFNLFECYPNPFNPTTTIEYQVSKTTKVKISVFNLVGEEVAILVDEEKTQGKYKLEFNGTNLSSGVYFYKMQSDNFISTKKFVLLK